MRNQKRREKDRRRPLFAPVPRCTQKTARGKFKRRYATEVDALFVIGKKQASAVIRPDRPLESRAYPCSHCGGWHLTHQEKRSPARRS